MLAELRRGVSLVRSDRRAETIAGVVLLALVAVPVVVEVIKAYRGTR